MKTLKQTVESGLGKRRDSLGESGSFIKGKSEFPLRKVQEAEKGWKTGISGQRENSEIALHFWFIVTQKTRKTRNVFALQKDVAQIAQISQIIVILQKLRSVKTENNLELIEKMLGVHLLF